MVDTSNLGSWKGLWYMDYSVWIVYDNISNQSVHKYSNQYLDSCIYSKLVYIYIYTCIDYDGYYLYSLNWLDGESWPHGHNLNKSLSLSGRRNHCLPTDQWPFQVTIYWRYLPYIRPKFQGVPPTKYGLIW